MVRGTVYLAENFSPPLKKLVCGYSSPSVCRTGLYGSSFVAIIVAGLTRMTSYCTHTSIASIQAAALVKH